MHRVNKLLGGCSGKPLGEGWVALGAAIVAQMLGLVCFDVYRVTHSPLAPFPVVAPLGLLVGFHVRAMRRAKAKSRAVQAALASVKAAQPDEGETGCLVEVNGVFVSLLASEEEALDEWMNAMPSSIAAKVNEAARFAQLLE